MIFLDLSISRGTFPNKGKNSNDFFAKEVEAGVTTMKVVQNWEQIAKLTIKIFFDALYSLMSQLTGWIMVLEQSSMHEKRLFSQHPPPFS